MKVEVELHPDVNADDPEVQKLLKQLEELRPQGFRQVLMRRLEGAMRAVAAERIPGSRERIERIHQCQVEAIVEAFEHLIMTNKKPSSTGLRLEGALEFRDNLLEKLK